MTRIFISYRRSDSQAITDRVYEHLVRIFGLNGVFMDTSNIPPGDHFPERLKKEIAECDVMLVIIGRTWTTVTGDDGTLRLESPEDFVRMEVERGLQKLDILGHSQMQVIPVLVNDADMPQKDLLPSTLLPLLNLNACKVRNDPDFKQDIERLIKRLGGDEPQVPKTLSVNQQPILQVVGILLMIMLVLVGMGVLALLNRDPDGTPSVPTIETSIIIPEKTQPPTVGVSLTPSPIPPVRALTDDENPFLEILEGEDAVFVLENMEFESVAIRSKVDDGDLLVSNSSLLRAIFHAKAYAIIEPSTMLQFVSVHKDAETLYLHVETGKIFIERGERLDVRIQVGERGADWELIPRGSSLRVEYLPDINELRVACFTGECSIVDLCGNQRMELVAREAVVIDTSTRDLEAARRNKTIVPESEYQGYNVLCGNCDLVASPILPANTPTPVPASPTPTLVSPTPTSGPTPTHLPIPSVTSPATWGDGTLYGVVYTSDDSYARLRSGPSTGDMVVGQVAPASVVRVYSKETRGGEVWYFVWYNFTYGWIREDLLFPAKDQTSAQATATAVRALHGLPIRIVGVALGPVQDDGRCYAALTVEFSGSEPVMSLFHVKNAADSVQGRTSSVALRPDETEHEVYLHGSGEINRIHEVWITIGDDLESNHWGGLICGGEGAE
ncbi:MAG: TIR domain-containing protein [Anaerolineae bacterium]|nr:TIR domain-containing protein [Anaerolineae bacterium]